MRAATPAAGQRRPGRVPDPPGALTNGAGTARVEVAFREACVELTVTNPLPAAPVDGGGSGHGLIGMRERADLTGGRLEAGVVEDGFRVHASLPYA